MTFVALLLLGLQQQAVRDDQCIACHVDQAADVKDTLHEKAGVGCVSCHGTDEIVNEKHKRTPAFRPAKLPQVAELCGSCHKGILEIFKPTEHFAAASKDDGDPKHRSSCSACHEYHTTPSASFPRIVSACLRCHEEGSPEIAQARAFFRRLSNQGKAVTDLETMMKRLARRPGVRTADLAAALDEGRSVHRELEIAQHGLAWRRLTADADASADGTRAAYNALASREGSFARRYIGLGLFLGLLALSAVLVARRARTLQGESGA
jgi:predicted CXXCH cytochrome family protein